MVVSFHFRERVCSAITGFPQKQMPMDAIFAHFTSIESPLHHRVPGSNFLYTFVVYTLLLPGSLCAYYPSCTSCNNTFCGDTAIPYPFGLQGSGCAPPSFQINCEHGARRVIGIEGHSYAVVDAFRNNLTSTIVDDDYFQDCKSSYESFDDLDDYSVFDSIQIQNFSLKVLKCGTLCVYDGVHLTSLSCNLD